MKRSESEDSEIEAEDSFEVDSHDAHSSLIQVERTKNSNPSQNYLQRYFTSDLDKQESKPQPFGFFGKRTFEEVENNIAEGSGFSHQKNWRLVSCIVKYGEDLRQEQFASQLILLILRIFRKENLSLWLKPIQILSTSPEGGIIATVTNALSLHKLRRTYDSSYFDLSDYFMATFGKPGSKEFKTAQKNFIRSMAGYSLLSYILQIKDRHNGNILIDDQGHIIHIDFGFMLSNSPGAVNWEDVPFKLTSEFIEVMGGQRSRGYQKFARYVVKGFLALRKHQDKVISLVEMITLSGNDMPCFSNGENTIHELRGRFVPGLSDSECVHYIHNLIDDFATTGGPDGMTSINDIL
eukprot:CAMPEP_0115018670 /NCGR_PEP_ID=MMETSP0216-20121206/28972_1 /TAXON_ID=223996 /ORGANISM="Protocruzia adherens, Strain Boccale" /LENGTH=350 /DNA_ID=CAMNT_0002389965 /DNA_START=138 /DNA_END=1191 /DNA_ORIENTATION=+